MNLISIKHFEFDQLGILSFFKKTDNKVYSILFFISFFFVFFSLSYPLESLSLTILILSVFVFFKDYKSGLLYLVLSIFFLIKLLSAITGSNVYYLVYFPYSLVFLIILYLNIIYGKKIRFPNTLVEKLLFFFSIYLLISTFYVSTDRAYGIVKLKMYVYSLIIFYIPVIYTETKKDIYKFLKSIFFFGIVLLALGLSQKLGISNPFIADYGVRFNIVGFNPIWVGRYLSYGMLIGILFITNYAKNFISNIGKILVLIVVISLQLYLLLLTGSRGPLVGFLLAGFYIILRKGNVNILKIAFYVAISAILLYVIYSLLPIAISERIINTNVSGVVTTYIRFGAFWEAIRGFLSSAFFGIGFGSYKFGGGFIQLLIYPHNVYLEVLSETGLIGAIIFVGFNLYILVQYQLLSKKIDYNLSTIIVALFIASFINSNLSGHIGANNYLWLSLGIMYSVKKIDFFEEKQLNKETTS